MTSALYMTSQWIAWLNLGVAYATGNDMVVFTQRGLFSPSPDFDLTPTAIARIAIAPMFDAGGSRVGVDVAGNPVRDPGLGRGTYAALSVAATRAPHAVYLLVVNRLPFQGQSVSATVTLDGITSAGTMAVRAVTSPSFESTAQPGDPSQVSLETSSRAIGAHQFSYAFPAHSITLLRIPAS
jgi:alpha-L-arabinofuranosidase